MNPFTYHRASDTADAVRSLRPDAGPCTMPIAGGTNLVDLMKHGIERPERLVDLGGLPLARIEPTPDGAGLRLGALCTNAETADHPEVASRYPLVAQAILSGASPQLRNMATNGGNLLQRTRCYYFYDPAVPCNKREPGSGCPARTGVNRIHAILGHSEHCIAVHPSDFCVALAALEAIVVVEGPDGERTIPFEDFHRLPGDTPHVETDLRPGEVIVAVDLPERGFADRSTYLKVRDRESYAFALVSVAAALSLDGDTVTEARLALGGVAHKPWRDREAEELLTGRPTTRESFAAAADRVVDGAEGFGGNDFKIELARRAVVRALEDAVSGHEESEVTR